MAHDLEPGAERKRHQRRQLDARAGIGVRAERRDAMRRLRRRPERRARQVADVTVAIELRPGPFPLLVINRHALAMERLGLQRRGRVGETPERRARRDNPLREPFRVAGRVDEAAQMIGGEVRAGGRQATVKGGGRHRACRRFPARQSRFKGWRRVSMRPDAGRPPSGDSFLMAPGRCNLRQEGNCTTMGALHDRQDNFRSPLDPYGAATHEVINQPVELADFNLYDSDAALKEAAPREGAGWATDGLQAFGARAGSAEYLEQGALANRNPPELDTNDRYGRRVDLVRFHPSYHALMRSGIEAGLHSSPWTEPGEGAHVARAARYYMQYQVEAGHCCPITMTFAATPCLRLQPDLAEQWLPKIKARVYDPRNVPDGREGEP